ncbi:MAG: hypothetical protein AAFY60_17920, partial [Myxococcota bacterium]
MTEPDNNERDILVARLLSGRDEPSVLEREALWSRLDKTLRAGARRRFGFGAFAVLAVAGAAAWLLYAPDPEFGIRGGDRGALALSCLVDEKPASCRAGATLVLSLGAPESKPFVSAFLEHPDGAIVWITPEETRKSRPVPESGALGVRLSAPAGMNRAVVVFTSEAIGREGIKAGFDGEFPETWERIERDFEV